MKIDEEIVGNYRLDFLIEDKVVVELKTRETVYQKDISQVLDYLKFNNLKVGLLLYFGNFKVKIKRLVL
ncbi:GxxExxY protein [Candidatus Berkelbacteria bacterium CG_4_9_14_0_2_um_filter_42_30]|uniref:GxxExxY protein n=3 Tax=Candidatus Berkelbacteria TaxID=1618330 RepID=A0A2M7K172_9BACT|nr:MAG: GxxExxY protein [Candidatus Berkelbacteria bacterium CG11_big_fil_rev_8_21_14_0_20_42_15]PIX29975.1 MAG: GxxExxY protein [Candidatus Berkelbacteria bacterium CG_4_8_14_3_um_filter_42_13]PJC65602.1 MAG: GxxExxY protein [Candidatus Berkelbacteria bacterium CG_4_9_14_0_2_um_filter_42_30]